MSTLLYGAIDLLDDNGPYHAQVGTGFGAWQSIQSETTSPFIDGAAVSGDATANREITLLVDVAATSRSGLIAACEALIGEANKAFNTLTWTADGASPMVYDTFRVRAPSRSDNDTEQFFVRTYTLTIPALPFARSAVLESPSAIAPVAVDLAVFSATSGFNGFGDADLAFGRPDTQLGGMVAVSGCTITTPTDSNGDHCVKLNPTGSGAMEAKSVNTVSVSAAGVGLNLQFGAASPNAGTQVGIEWFNGATSLYVDWGPVRANGNLASLEAMSAKPAAATKVGYRIRTTNSVATPFLANLRLGTRTSVTGDTNLGFVADSTAPFTPQKHIDTFAERLVLASSANLSTQPSLTIWSKRASGGSSITNSYIGVRLHSGTSGNWSEWTSTFTATDDSTWVDGMWRAITFDLTAPTQVSAVGAVSLTAVNVVTLFSDFMDLGAVGAGVTTGAGTGPRGTVFDLASIDGSAPSTASAHLWSGTALTDLIVVTLDALDGPPMVAIASNAAALPAPASYNGVYRILASRTDAVSVTTPQVVITQKLGATTVASVTLKGKSRPGFHYVDFGTTPLPLVAVPDENVSVNYTVAITPTSANWGEFLPLNVNNSLVMLEQINPARKHVWVDEPDIVVGLGDVWVGTTDRTDAASPLQAVDQSSPFTVKAPNVKVLAYSTAAGPSLSLSYYPHYLDGLA